MNCFAGRLEKQSPAHVRNTGAPQHSDDDPRRRYGRAAVPADARPRQAGGAVRRPVPVAEAHHFGIVEVDSDWRVTGFVEKPKEGAKTIPGRPDMVPASMGNYIFKANVMIDVLQRNALRDAAHDFGKEIIPAMYPRMKVFAYDFGQNYVPGEAELNRGYWRDVGTIDSYFAASLDLVAVTPLFNLYNAQWPM